MMIIIFSFFLLLIIVFIILTINIKLEIENLKITLTKSNNKITNNKSKILLKIYILKKIKICEFDLKKIDLKNEKVKKRIQKQFEIYNLNLDIINLLRNVNYIVEKMNLKVYIGFCNAAITGISVGIIYTIISVFLKEKIKDYTFINYKVNPVYKDDNTLKIKIDTLIKIDVRNVLIILKILRKGSEEKNVRTSNRRSYAYSNE